MRLLSLVEVAAHTYQEAPCCVVAPQSLPKHQINNLGNSQPLSSSPSSKVLSYQEVWTFIQHHEQWLGRTVSQSFSTGNHAHEGKEQDNHNMVVAYLSSNSVDLWLSLLACTSDSVKALVALLNTRWTPVEMAKALETDDCSTSSFASSSYSSSSTAKTLILYGPGFRFIAEQVVLLLGHEGYCLPLPTITDTIVKQQLTPVNQAKDSSATAKTARQRQNLLTMDLSTFVLWAQNSDKKGNRQTRNHFRGASTAGTAMTKNPRNDREKLIEKEAGDDDDAMIVFTSGTTSKAKGVRLGHAALVIQALAKRDFPCCYSADTVVLASTVPLFHVGGLSSCLATMLVGGTLVFPTTTTTDTDAQPSRGGFDVSIVQTSLSHRTWPINTLVVVPAMLVVLFSSLEQQQQQQQNYVFPKVRLLLIGGQSASEKTLRQIALAFPNARVVQTFACTEAASSLTFLKVKLPTMDSSGTGRDRKAGTSKQLTTDTSIGNCVGSPPAHVELRLVNQEMEKKETAMPAANESNNHHEGQGYITTPYQPGIIVTRGPHVMNGYWKRGTRKSVSVTTGDSSRHSHNDWFRTNDLGYWDNQGQLFFCGRVNDVIRTGGETVLAQQVERVLLLHPNVLECAVFAKLDERFGEAVACALVLADQKRIRPDSSSSPSNSAQPALQQLETSLKQWCEDHGLANYKRPRYIFVVDELPKNSSGKVLKHKLVQIYGKPKSKL